MEPVIEFSEEAASRLAELEKSEASTDPGDIPGQPIQREDGTTTRAGGKPEAKAQTPAETKTDTPAAPETPAKADKSAEAKSQDEANKGKTPEQLDAEKKAAEAQDKRTRYAKNQERLERTWDNVNKRKTELDTREQQLTQREQQLTQRQTDLDRKAQQSQAQYKPEDYEQAARGKMERAKGLHLQADGLDAKAKKAEDDGDYKEAARLSDQAKGIRKAANKEEGNAEDLQAHAEQLRKNPPPSAQQLEAKTAEMQKAWMMKAAQEHPELAVKDSALQKDVAARLSHLHQTDRELASHPSIVYYVTKMSAAETAAARVPVMEKELGELRTKVKELEGLTAPGGEGSVQRPSTDDKPKSDEEERAELGQLAAEVGGFR